MTILTKDEVLAIGDGVEYSVRKDRYSIRHGDEVEALVATCLASMAERDAAEGRAKVATNAYENIKECWDTQCSHVAEACGILGGEGFIPDSWTLREWAARVVRDRDAAIERAEAAEAKVRQYADGWEKTIDERDLFAAEADVLRANLAKAEAKVRQYELALSTTTEVDPTKTESVAPVPGNAFDVIRADRDFWKKQAQDVTASAKAILGTGKLHPESLTSSAQRVVTERNAAIERAALAEDRVDRLESDELPILLASLSETKANLATLREALKHYAWDDPVDFGERARAALAKVKP